MSVEKIEHNGELFALIVRDSFDKEGLSFFTEDKHGFQLAVHNVPGGKRYRAHITLPFKEIRDLQPNKIYYVKKGKVGIDYYDEDGNKLEIYSTLSGGDMILFVCGGHGVDILEDSSMIELKQGPYRGTDDKIFLEDKSE